MLCADILESETSGALLKQRLVRIARHRWKHLSHFSFSLRQAHTEIFGLRMKGIELGK
jgi:hypothetical protein